MYLTKELQSLCCFEVHPIVNCTSVERNDFQEWLQPVDKVWRVWARKIDHLNVYSPRHR